MTQQPLISCTNLHLSIGGATILRDLTFDIPPGKHTVLQGESGAGKTTLLKLLLGFLKPTSGDIRFHGDIDTGNIRHHTAWLPQDLDLGAGKVEELMQKPFSFKHNQSKRPGRQGVVSTLDQLGLSEQILDQSFQTLSTGQRQRVGLGICHLLDKPLLLLDEPTSALDKASKQRIASLLLAHTNKTVISTSHDPFWVGRADHIISLN